MPVRCRRHVGGHRHGPRPGLRGSGPAGSPRRLAESQGFRWSMAQADAVARIWNGHTAACRLAAGPRASSCIRCPRAPRRPRRGLGLRCSTSCLAPRGAAEGLRLVAIVDLTCIRAMAHTNSGPAIGRGALRHRGKPVGGRLERRIASSTHRRRRESYREALQRSPRFSTASTRTWCSTRRAWIRSNTIRSAASTGERGVPHVADAFVIGHVRRRAFRSSSTSPAATAPACPSACT